ncbi:hypothetical protein GDO81_000786 [Engystomops pustulosus]|uniref:Prostate androgen-regulated mucin-like protein 1 n=1 Tax=Engystomops pustulosus TaxID=76066 RepID=A0AAV7D772_ENGPU|nr:hypothetical protein GDO81_000786 [Engystomops pustulosus]
MDGSWILCAALLLLTGLHINSAAPSLSSESLSITSSAPTHGPTELPSSTVSTNTVTFSGTDKTSVSTTEPEHITLTVSTITQNDNKSVIATSEVTPGINKNDSSDSTAKPSSTTEISTVNNTNTNESTATTLNTATSSSSSTSITTSAVTTSQPPSTSSTEFTSGPTNSSNDATGKGNETETSSTDPTASTGSTTGSLNTPSKPVSQENTQSSGTDSSSTKSNPTDDSKLTPASKTEAVTGTIPITTEQNVELKRALSPGSVAAITVIVIVLVLVIFGGAAYLKIRHSSYGRLLEDQDYGSLGNYNNPLYDDS